MLPNYHHLNTVLEYALVSMLALNNFNCEILKIINYCKLCNTQNRFVPSNTLPYAELQLLVCMNDFGTLSYAELQLLVCMYDPQTLFYIDIQCFVSRNALWLRSTHCNTALRSFSTQHCKSQ